MTSGDRTLLARDGATIRFYEVRPAAPRGGLVLLGETFGLNSHIRKVADAYARDGYHVLAPQTLERAEPGVNLEGYGPPVLARSRELRSLIDPSAVVADLVQLHDLVSTSGPAAYVGFSWGALLAYQAAAITPESKACVCYYGAGLADVLDAAKRPPLLFHLGVEDSLVPAEDRARIAAVPDADIHLYSAGHGFNCDERSSYHSLSADLAGERTKVFLERHLR